MVTDEVSPWKVRVLSERPSYMEDGELIPMDHPNRSTLSFCEEFSDYCFIGSFFFLVVRTYIVSSYLCKLLKSRAWRGSPRKFHIYGRILCMCLSILLLWRTVVTTSFSNLMFFFRKKGGFSIS